MCRRDQSTVRHGRGHYLKEHAGDQDRAGDRHRCVPYDDLNDRARVPAAGEFSNHNVRGLCICISPVLHRNMPAMSASDGMDSDVVAAVCVWFLNKTSHDTSALYLDYQNKGS